MEKYVIRFIGYDASESLAKADGIITPSGIFEKFKSTSGYGGTRHWVECNKDLLAKREKEAFQNYKRGGWTAFLLRSVDNGNGKWEDTDLAKRFLNAFFKTVRSGDPNAHV